MPLLNAVEHLQRHFHMNVRLVDCPDRFRDGLPSAGNLRIVSALCDLLIDQRRGNLAKRPYQCACDGGGIALIGVELRQLHVLLRIATEAIEQIVAGKVTTKETPPAPMAHALTDLAGHFLSVDDGFCNLIRRERPDIIGRTILELTAERDRPLNAEKLALLRESGTPFVIRKTYLRGDGGMRVVENSVSLLTDGLSGSVLAATVSGVPDASQYQFAALVRVGRILLAEQKARIMLGPELEDQNWRLTLAAYLLETDGKPVWAEDVCETAGGDRRANLLRIWELVQAGVFEIDGKAASLERTSLRISLDQMKALETHLAGTLAI